MKLETCDWVPSHVVHWLSTKLEAKGIPGASYSHTLLSYLHPYFCPHPDNKDPKPRSSLGTELPGSEDFDDSIDSDADFPQLNKKIRKSKPIIKKIAKSPLQQEYHKRALECLSSASDKIEELDQLLEELFDILGGVLTENKLRSYQSQERSFNPSSFPNFGIEYLCPEETLGSSVEVPVSQLESASESIDSVDINDGQPTVSDIAIEEISQINCERSIRDMIGGKESSTIPSSFGGNVGTSSGMKEEWEYLAQLVNAQNGTPQQSHAGSRLFERATGAQDPFHNSPGLGLSSLENRMLSEPWEDSLSIWKTENTLNANRPLCDPLPSTFVEALDKYDYDGGSNVTLMDDREPQCEPEIDIVKPFNNQQSEFLNLAEVQNPIGTHSLPSSIENNANEISVNEHTLLDSKDIYMQDERFSDYERLKQANLDDELSKSFRQLGIDIWKEQPDSLDQSNQFLIDKTDGEHCYKLPAKNIRGCDPFPKIPRGPAGPYTDLNHTETSGFSSVIPHRENQLPKRDNLRQLDVFATSDSYRYNRVEEKENLLTSPRTHFIPIKQDSQGSNEEDKDEVQVVSEVHTNFKNPEFLFQRTGSGNLILENDFIEGSPKKYMVYKEPQSKFVGAESPDIVEASPTTHFENAACGFAPKFKIRNNEKFCQTESSSNIIENPISFSPFRNDIFKSQYQNKAESIWESNFQENIKKIWNEEDNPSGKEIWEIGLDNIPMGFGSSDQSWNKDSIPSQDSIPLEKLLKKREREGSDVLSRIKFLWPSVNKDQSESSDCVEEKSNEEESSWSKSFLRNIGEDKIHPYANTSWNANKEELSDDDPLGSDDNIGSKFKWTKWAVGDNDDINLVPLSSPTNNGLTTDTLGQNESVMEDLEILEPDWDLNEGFEWDPALVEMADGDNNEREVFYCEVDGQQVILPVEYLEDDIYDKYFGPSETKLSGSLPDFPYSESADSKKLPFKIRRKGSRSAAHSNRPCTFYLEGNCLRTDCKFTHDLSSITCRFWEEDTCFKAETCPFLHGYPTHRKRNRSEGDQISTDAISLAKLKDTTKCSKGRSIHKSSRPPPSSFEIDSEADFPSLGSSFESRANSLEEISMATSIKPTGKKAKFVALSDTFLKQVKGTSGKSNSQRRKKSKYDNARCLSQVNSEKQLASKVGATLFKSEIHSPKPSYHEDGTVSDF